MSISAVSSSSCAPTPSTGQSGLSQMQQLFKQLSNALQSGNLAGAQKAYNSIEKKLQSSQPSGETSDGAAENAAESPVQSDFAALGQALSSGNLSEARNDFAKLQSDARSAGESSGSSSAGSAHRGHYHRHDLDPSSTSTASTSASSSSASGASGPATNSTGSSADVSIFL